MKYVGLPSGFPTRPLPFYLAMEEYVLQHMDAGDDDRFFMWQVNPTVIFGRNQIGEKEVDLDYCRTHGIEVYRRKSGGGCVFADMSNIMFSYITRRPTTVEGTFSHYTTMVASMLRSLGLDATATTRNDILIDGRKVSGNAYYHTERGSIVHGTMLFDTDMAHMAHALTPSAAKLASKGVKSVNSRITVLSEHITLSLDEFKDYARQKLCDTRTTLTDNDIAEIERLSQPYFSDSWRWGFDRRAGLATPRRIEGAGEFSVNVDTDPTLGTIRAIDIAGDFFVTADIDEMLIRPLIGKPRTPEALAEALCGIDASQAIPGLTTGQFIKLIC